MPLTNTLKGRYMLKKRHPKIRHLQGCYAIELLRYEFNQRIEVLNADNDPFLLNADTDRHYNENNYGNTDVHDGHDAAVGDADDEDVYGNTDFYDDNEEISMRSVNK
ncbi:unnamed protein product [Meganyctiphanes norvegica]|uniref:Uncharacterized protein n=1 Tax=Meganyctiphanes norvegica TaxID=48144 RepID=A0AAV2SEJ3_MEGNR